MKKIHEMSESTIKKLLQAIDKNFHRITKDGIVVKDFYTDLFPLYQELLSDFFNEKDRLYGAYQFTMNMTYGGCIHYLLGLELYNRTLKYVKN